MSNWVCAINSLGDIIMSHPVGISPPKVSSIMYDILQVVFGSQCKHKINY